MPTVASSFQGVGTAFWGHTGAETLAAPIAIGHSLGTPLARMLRAVRGASLAAQVIHMKSALLLFVSLCGCDGATDSSRVTLSSTGGAPTAGTSTIAGGAFVQFGSDTAGVGGASGAGGTASTVSSTSNTGGTSLAASGGVSSSGGSTIAAASGSTGTSIRACKTTSLSNSAGSCHSTKDCSDTIWYKCCTGSGLAGDCWGPGACPLPPSQCQYSSNRVTCSIDSDCGDAGTCEKGVSGCPQCPWSQCKYPPPKCTQAPDSCGGDARCQADGTCKPLACNSGYACPDGSRCSMGSDRADAHGCELIPCNDGWACDENTRCVIPVSASSHGCAALTCATDSECDCGFCVNGSCKANLGYCTPAPS